LYPRPHTVIQLGNDLFGDFSIDIAHDTHFELVAAVDDLERMAWTFSGNALPQIVFRAEPAAARMTTWRSRKVSFTLLVRSAEPRCFAI
jgi:hypothetical protein